MSIFDINYYTKALEWLPPDKRLPKLVGYLKALLTPVQWLRNKFLGDYRLGVACNLWVPAIYDEDTFVELKQIVYRSLVDAATFPTYDISGATTYTPGQFVNHDSKTRVCIQTTYGLDAPPWDSGATYAIGDLVLYEGDVYSRRIPNVVGPYFVIHHWHKLGPQYGLDESKWAYDVPPSVNWEQYLASFIGVNDRILFNGQKLVLEYALNKYFLTNFRQPGLLGYYYPASTQHPSIVADAGHLLHSDIFTLNNDHKVVGFRVGVADVHWQGGVSYSTGAVVIYGGSVYECLVANFDLSLSNASHWKLLGPRMSTVAATDTGNTAYSQWEGIDYDTGAVVIYNNYLFLCIKDAHTGQIPDDVDYWLKVDAVGYRSPFAIGNNFTIYFPSAVYAQTTEGEVRHFVNKIIPAGIVYSIKTY